MARSKKPPARQSPAGGSLNVVGLGFTGVGHVTPETLSCISSADKLFYLGADGISKAWLGERNPSLESLYDAYSPGKDRLESYEEMIERMLDPVRNGREVCVAFYGHPGVFVYPSHEAIRRARAEGLAARMVPAISAEDCLFADLEIDPAEFGCASYEATDFIVRPRQVDTTASLILWQAGGIGVVTFESGLQWNPAGVGILTERLLELYPARHGAFVYEAAVLPVCNPVRLKVAIEELPSAPVTVYSTLFIPPVSTSRIDPEVFMSLGLVGNPPS